MFPCLHLALWAALPLLQLVTTGADAFTPRESRYKLHPGDVVGVSYRYTPEYDAMASVQPDGFASLPLLGDIKLGGLTLEEAHESLVTKASERLEKPEIVLNLKEFEKPYYIVGGEVGNPGRFEIHGRMTALRAVEIAGGFKASANSSQILLIRPIDDRDGQTRLINLKKVIDHAELQEDVELRAGDLLVVPKNRFSKVEPYIRLVNVGFYLNPFNF